MASDAERIVDAIKRTAKEGKETAYELQPHENVAREVNGWRVIVTRRDQSLDQSHAAPETSTPGPPAPRAGRDRSRTHGARF